MRKWLVLILLLAVGVAGFLVLRERQRHAPPPPPDDVPVANDTFALLVGCTEYPELEKISDPEVYASAIRLLGPANDAALMQTVLRQYLGVPEANVRLLTGWPADADARPTRSNILGHLDHLATQVTKGSHVLFTFAGHGSQQLDAPGGDEADGYDEILLPADAGVWEPESGGVKGVITDDEIRQRLMALRDAGATVWALFDCCHSGTMMRGDGSEAEGEVEGFDEVRMRSLPPHLLGVPKAPAARGVGGEDAAGGLLQRRGRSLEGIAALYAARSWEKAPEMILPRSRFAADRESHGLCTFQVARALQQYGGSLTIAEVFDRVLQAYAALPWSKAAPHAEGDLSLRVLPGKGRAGVALLLRREGQTLVLDAGSLRGLTVGSVLEVYRAGHFRDPNARWGRVTLVEVGPLRSVCGPAPGGPDPATIPGGVPAEVVRVAPGGLPLRLSLLDAAGSEMSAAAAERVSDLIAADARARADFPVVGKAQADWHIRARSTGPDGPARFLLAAADGERGLEPFEVEADSLASALERVRRAENLRRCAREGSLSELPDRLLVEARLQRLGAEQPEPFQSGTDMLPGDRLLLQIVNRTGDAVDVTLKNIDAAQDVSDVWPRDGPSHLLSPVQRDPLTVPDLVLGDGVLGRESLLIVLAVRKKGAPALDLGLLTGSGEPEEDEVATRQGEHALLEALAPDGVKSRSGDDTRPVSLAIHELVWNTTWGRLDPPAALLAGLTPLASPIEGLALSAAGTPPPGRDATWSSAVVLAENPRSADVLVLSGGPMGGGEGPIAIFLDEDGDARLRETSLEQVARQAAAGELPVELLIFAEGSTMWAAYPRTAGDPALGVVRLRSEIRDRASLRFDLGTDGWSSRATCGPWLSTAFVPAGGPNPAQRGGRLIRALRLLFVLP